MKVKYLGFILDDFVRLGPFTLQQATWLLLIPDFSGTRFTFSIDGRYLNNDTAKKKVKGFIYFSDVSLIVTFHVIFFIFVLVSEEGIPGT